VYLTEIVALVTLCYTALTCDWKCRRISTPGEPLQYTIQRVVEI